MKFLLIIPILVQFLFSDTIISEYSSLLYNGSTKIENIEYLGITDKLLIAYKTYDSDSILYLHSKYIINIYDNDNHIIDIYKKKYVSNKNIATKKKSNVRLINKINNAGSSLKKASKDFYIGHLIQIISILIYTDGINSNNEQDSQTKLVLGAFGLLTGWTMSFLSFTEISDAGTLLEEINDEDIENINRIISDN